MIDGPRDDQLDAACFDDERHEAYWGFPLNEPRDDDQDDDEEDAED